MIKELTVSGRSGVRYIITKTTGLGSAVRIDEAVSIYASGMQLLVSAHNGSDICLHTVIKALAKLRENGTEIHACFRVDGLFAGGIRKALVNAGLNDSSLVCSDESAEAARKYSRYELTVPDSDTGAFFTLSRADGKSKGTLIIGCEQAELEKALAAAAGSGERKGAEQ